MIRLSPVYMTSLFATTFGNPLAFFFNDTATTEIYTLSLHDALPICARPVARGPRSVGAWLSPPRPSDRKSTRLNSSHITISYAVFCLKKKKKHYHGPLVDHDNNTLFWSREFSASSCMYRCHP